jgi:hypothetical protein
LQIFENICHSQPENSNAKKYACLVYLLTKNYEKALERSDELAGMKDVYSNQGLFLKAITLLQRNKRGDKAQAKQLLERIVNEKAEGRREAERWLKEWK